MTIFEVLQNADWNLNKTKNPIQHQIGVNQLGNAMILLDEFEMDLHDEFDEKKIEEYRQEEIEKKKTHQMNIIKKNLTFSRG
jgi:hypothetical protein